MHVGKRRKENVAIFTQFGREAVDIGHSRFADCGGSSAAALRRHALLSVSVVMFQPRDAGNIPSTLYT